MPGRDEIEKLTADYRRLAAKPVSTLTARTEIAAASAAGAKLYEALLRPVEKSLAGKKRVTIVPDGTLAYLPFEALGAAPLLTRMAVSYAPSASVLAALRERRSKRTAPPKTLLAVADPSLGGKQIATERGFSFAQLPNARKEVQAISALFPAGSTRSLIGDSARESAVKQEKLGEYRYLHFAAHGYFDEEQPERSGLVLAQTGNDGEDGFLQAREMAGLELSSDLITLSACQSGLGKVLAGEGVIGLPRALLLAGAQSVAMSLWNVNDEAASVLMARFYSGLKAGLAKDEALRAAKLAVMKEPRWRHPYYWAPFVLQGDAGGR